MSEMSREKALEVMNILRFGTYGEIINTYEMINDVLDVAIEALKERPHEKWEYLKEHITEMRDADGELNQKDTCQFILNLMGVIEREGEASDKTPDNR